MKTVIFFFQLFFVSFFYYSHAETSSKDLEVTMSHVIEHQNAKFFIGLELRTNNKECSLTMPAHKNKFFEENIPSKIPNKINDNILALYTDYEGDHTKPYSWLLGCEVSSLENIPKGLVGKVIPESKYAVYTTQGLFPNGLIAVWQDVWKANLQRAYTSDFEVYQKDFDPQHNPEVKVYVAIQDALLKSVHQGLREFIYSSSLCSPLIESDYQETSQNSIYACGIDYVCLNGVIEKDNNRIPSEEQIDQAIQYFSKKNLPFMWWTSAKVLETKGFQFGGILTGIALDISKKIPNQNPTSKDLKIQMVKTEEELKIFSALAANAFGLNVKATEQYFDINNVLMKKEEQIHFLAYVNNIPVGTATLSIGANSAGVWNLSTSEDYRKQGIGGALVHASLFEAKKRDYKEVMAILMPKGLAWGLFQKLGFQAVCEFPFYIYGVSADEIEK